MIYDINEKAVDESFYIVKSVFTEDECFDIINFREYVEVSHISNLIQTYDEYSLLLNGKTHWIYDRICNIIMNVNNDVFHYDLTGIDEQLLMKIFSDDNHFYKWHRDNIQYSNSMVKLTAMIQLSDPNLYKNGNIEIWNYSVNVFPKDIGSVILFPSYSLTRVQPAYGMKAFLTLYAVGPKFR